MNHLPDEAARIATEQGWNDESIIIHLLGFIQHDASGASPSTCGRAPTMRSWRPRLAPTATATPWRRARRARTAAMCRTDVTITRHVEVHSASVQDRDGAAFVLDRITRRFPFLVTFLHLRRV